jgi:hypothetical protein
MASRLCVLIVLALAVPARADGFYYTESVGGTKIKDDLGSFADSALRIRLSLGMRQGSWAFEAWLAGDLAFTRIADGPGGDYAAYNQDASLMQYGFDVKYLQPIAEHFDVYLRGSISRAQTDHMRGLEDYAGRGLGLGAGIQVKGKVRALGFLAWPLFFTGFGPKVTAALFVDDGFDFYRLHEHGDLQNGAAIDAQLSHMTFGFAVGSDF